MRTVNRPEQPRYLLRRLLFQFLLFLRTGTRFLGFCKLLENLFELKCWKNSVFSIAKSGDGIIWLNIPARTVDTL